MAQWQIFKGKNKDGAPLPVGEQFDDGLIFEPHEDGFSNEAMLAEMKKRGGDGWSYIGRSTQMNSKMEDVIGAEVSAIIEDEGNPISDEAVARKLVLADYGLRES